MQAKVYVNTEEKIGVISPGIYGQFLEHGKDFIYPSLWDDTSPLSDGSGLRRDVTSIVKELGTPVIRWPGGSFADLYNWQDGVGPRSSRPLTRNWQSGALEKNAFGTDEFMRFCELSNAAPYINVNLGTGSLTETLKWLDYCNGEQNTPEVLLRRKCGRTEPYAVTYWGIGNETWADWEAGQMSAARYGLTLRNWAQFMKRHSPFIKILGVGSDGIEDKTWDDDVLSAAASVLDYLTIHLYVCSIDRRSGNEFESNVYAPTVFAQKIRKLLNRIKPYSTLSHPIRISMDEWNIRHFNRRPDDTLVIDHYSPRCLQDAIFTAGVFHEMIRLSPHVDMANYVLLINGNGVLQVHREGVVKTALYYVFKHYADKMRGVAVETTVMGETKKIPEPIMMWPGKAITYDAETVTVLDAAAALKDDELTISFINRSLTETIQVKCELPDNANFKVAGYWQLVHDNIYAYNDFYHPANICPVSEDFASGLEIPDELWVVPPHSIKTITLRRI